MVEHALLHLQAIGVTVEGSIVVEARAPEVHSNFVTKVRAVRNAEKLNIKAHESKVLKVNAYDSVSSHVSVAAELEDEHGLDVVESDLGLLEGGVFKRVGFVVELSEVVGTTLLAVTLVRRPVSDVEGKVLGHIGNLVVEGEPDTFVVASSVAQSQLVAFKLS